MELDSTGSCLEAMDLRKQTIQKVSLRDSLSRRKDSTSTLRQQ